MSIKNHTTTLYEVLSEKTVYIIFFLGFSSGLPILLVFGTLSAWLNDAGISKSTITYFSWASLGYAFKFLWSPLIDQGRLPIITRLLGKRRSWLLLCQILLLLILAGMAFVDPAGGDGALTMMALLAVALGFVSASQDIVVDAYRIEITPPHLMGMSATAATFGYRVGMIIAGTLGLVLADTLGSTNEHYHYVAWQTTYLVMACFMWVGIITTLLIKEPKNQKAALDTKGSQQLLLLFLIILIPFIAVFYWWKPLLWLLLGQTAESVAAMSHLAQFMLSLLRFLTATGACIYVAYLLILTKAVKTDVALDAYWTPVREFVQRYPLKLVVLILLLIGFYRVSDMVLGVIATVFYQDLGFGKADIGYVSKFFGLGMTLVGVFIGGWLSVRLGVMRVLLLGAILAAVTNLLFVWLARVGDNFTVLVMVISADNLAAGIATIAFVTFLSRLSNIQFTAVQYAVFSSLMALLPRFIGGYAGTIVEISSYQTFFLITTLMGLPIIVLVWLVGKQLTFNEDKA